MEHDHSEARDPDVEIGYSKRALLLLGLFLATSLLVWNLLTYQQAMSVTPQVKQLQSLATPYPNCRFGVTTNSNVQDYDVASLNVGWYLNWGTSVTPASPGGAEFVQMVRLSQGRDGYSVMPPTATLISLVNANPGKTWVIGNEPDGYPIAGDTDSIDPDLYARAYHDLYQLIKGQDARAKVAIGAIIQPTPLRFEYLDTVWSSYLNTFSETIPVDLWNIHSFILRETVVAPDPEPCGQTVPVWGAYIPRGSSATSGELYCLRDQDNLAVFWQRIREFRQWMADRGERNKPLIISEYGVLFPEDYTDEDGNPFGQARVGSFMTSSFDLLLNETDPEIGYVHDGNRLVQGWAWFSLSSDPFFWGGTLFDPVSKEIRQLGRVYRDYTAALTPTVDLMVAQAYSDPRVFWHESAPVTAVLQAVVSNIGNNATSLPITVTFYDGSVSGTVKTSIGPAVVITDGLRGCADFRFVEQEWTGLGPGVHAFHVEVAGQSDAGVGNNVFEGKVLVATERHYLPLSMQQVQ
jgi:hypothetical protein